MKTVFFKSNQGDHENHRAEPDYIIYHFSELPRAIKFLSE
jgi:putative hydrolase of the HAD superfamily